MDRGSLLKLHTGFRALGESDQGQLQVTSWSGLE